MLVSSKKILKNTDLVSWPIGRDLKRKQKKLRLKRGFSFKIKSPNKLRGNH